jgi:hypothetical protein
MTLARDLSRRLARHLLDHGSNRLRRTRPQWAQAMEAEALYLANDGDRLRWAAGCALASYRAPQGLDALIYPAALLLGLALMTAYQWTVDEGLLTVAVLAVLGAALGLIAPRRSVVSGVLIGLVVAGVNAFETISGVRPAYEDTAHSLVHDAKWLVLVAPSLIAAAFGRYAGLKLRSARE